ncbi:MAG TPA: YdcF family protein [Terracidiphilus sp.]|nr:YdcF family protein [Terracidiphilus sp.]
MGPTRKFTVNMAARIVVAVLVVLLLVAATWCRWVYGEIETYARMDQAAPSDAIAVFGAAEYDGRPSPVYRARLEHAEALYDKEIAPLVVTLGGDGGDQYSEGGVGRQYLMSQGIPESSIIAETTSRSTAEAVRRLAVIARTNGFQRIVVVSDAVHMFRIHSLCAAQGLTVLTSPRPRVNVEENPSELSPILHEMVTFAAWQLHLE